MDNRKEIKYITECVIDEFYLIEGFNPPRSYMVQFVQNWYSKKGLVGRFRVVSSTENDIKVGMIITLNPSYNEKSERKIWKI